MVADLGAISASAAAFSDRPENAIGATRMAAPSSLFWTLSRPESGGRFRA